MDDVIFDTGAYVIEQMYHVIDQALIYTQLIEQMYHVIEQMYRSQGFLVCPNGASDVNLDDQDWLKMGSKFYIEYAEFYGGPDQSLNGSN